MMTHPKQIIQIGVNATHVSDIYTSSRTWCDPYKNSESVWKGSKNNRK